jgi:hypothetical protein
MIGNRKATPMLETRLRIGDHICLINHYLIYPAGTQGIITHIYRFTTAAYRVRFEGQAHDEIIYRDAFTVFPPGSRPGSAAH